MADAPYEAVAATALDGGARLDLALRAYYFNYNMHLVVSEGFMNSLIGEKRVERGPVVDFILGANVRGWQTTNVTVGVDLKPSTTDARFNLILAGIVQSTTSGTTPQATIFTSGYHRFNVAKPITFDGDHLTAERARIHVRANNTTTGARTKFSGIPLLGGFANSIAMGEARKKKGESEAIAASRVRDRVLPRFEEETAAELDKANADLEAKLIAKLQETSLFPSARDFRTTESFLSMSSRLMDAGELGGSRVRTPDLSNDGIALQIHESLANNALDRMGIAGRTLNETELLEEFETQLSSLLGKPVSLRDEKEEGEAKEPTTFEFDDTNPVRVRFRNGTISLILRAAFKGVGKNKEDIPPQIVTIDLELEVDGDKVNLSRSVSSRGVAGGVQARSRVISERIEEAIEEKPLDGKVEFEIEEGREPTELHVQSISSVGGWLTVVLK